MLILAGVARAQVPPDLADRIRSAYAASESLRFEVQEKVETEPRLDVRTVRVTYGPGMGVRTDDLSPLLARTMRGVNGVIDRDDGLLVRLSPAGFQDEEQPARIRKQRPPGPKSSLVRMAPMRRGQWILDQFRGPTNVETAPDRIVLRAAKGAVEVTLGPDLSFLGAVLAEDVNLRIECRSFHDRSPMSCRWPREIVTTAGRPGAAGVTTVLTYSAAQVVKLPDDEFEWSSYASKAVDEESGNLLAAPSPRTADVRPSPAAPPPRNPSPAPAVVKPVALPPPRSPGAPWLWALGITALAASGLLWLRRRFSE